MYEAWSKKQKKGQRFERTPVIGKWPACYGEEYHDQYPCINCILITGCSWSSKTGKELRSKGLIPA